MNKILVTGGAGFIGFFLVKKLLENENNEIIIIDNMVRGRMDFEFKELLSHDRVFFIEADLTKKDVFETLPKDIQYIYHLAAVIGVQNVMENPDKVLYVNAISTLNLIEYAKELQFLKKFLFSSTSEIYAGTLKHFGIEVPTDETVQLTLDDIKSPRTTYMLSKMYGESILFNYGEKYDIPFSIVRYHNVYGPRMGFLHVVPEMFIKIMKQDVVEVASPEHTRAMCYVDDAVEMTILVCESLDTKSEILNIGNPKQEISIINLVKIIAKVLDRKITLKSLPNTEGSPKRRSPNINKIINLVGYEPEVNLEEGIEKTFQWYEDKLDNRYE
jgi:nucleoside-diphosphate-sugar epimerase